MADAKLEIILAAQDASKQAFDDYKRRIDTINKSIADLNQTSKASQAAFVAQERGIENIGLSIGSFAKGLGAATAVVATAGIAIEKALDLSEVGAGIERQEAAFKNLNNSVGADSAEILKSIRSVSRGFVSDAEIIRSAGTAMMLGIPADKLTEMMKIAEATSRQTGQTVTEAFANITLGVARESRLILDNLGIIVDVEKANEDYAKSLRKTSAELTEAERKQAFMNSVLKSGNELVKRIGGATGDLDGINKLVASQSNLWNEVAKTIAHITATEIPLMIKAVDWVAEAVKKIRPASQSEAKKTEAWNYVETMQRLQSRGYATREEVAAAEADYWKRFPAQAGPKSSEELKRLGSFSTKQWNVASWKEREGQWVDFTADQLKEMKESRDKYLKDIEAQAKSERERIERIWADYKPRYSGSQRSEAELADELAADEWKKSWEPYFSKHRLPESQQSDAFLENEKITEEWKKKNADAMNYLSELSEHTAARMQDNFSDLFFDAFRGELKSLEDYAKSIFDSLLRAMADMSGQMATQAIFGAKAVGGTQGGGGLVGWLAGLVGGSGDGPELLNSVSAQGNVFGPNGIERFANGGIVTRPTLFPAATGIGLMGEAGPEGILPLKRNAAGRLGVEASGGAPSVYMPITVVAPDGRMSRESLSQTGYAAYMGLRRAWGKNA